MGLVVSVEKNLKEFNAKDGALELKSSSLISRLGILDGAVTVFGLIQIMKSIKTIL